jgi:UDP-glucose 4-epimerase
VGGRGHNVRRAVQCHPGVAVPPDGAYLIVGGAGFIGSHFADRLLADPSVHRVTVFDNFSSGKDWHLSSHLDDPRLEVVKGDVKDLAHLTDVAGDHDVLIHLASNPDIARAASEPAIDFDEGTLLTHHVVEAARRCGIPQVLYASGSGVYGDLGHLEATEDHGPLLPVSTYGASKLAGEALLSSYCSMFGLRARAFRFGNVVGPRQTHGVGFDFLRRLRANPSELTILGDGTQSKSYVYVDDVVDAVMLAAVREAADYQVFNIATGDYITVTEIADIVCHALGLSDVRYVYTGGDRGWKGDVPIVRLDSSRIRALGWFNRLSSAQALRHAVDAMLREHREDM